MLSECFKFFLPILVVPSLKVTISSIGAPRAGQKYSLSCKIISGTDGIAHSRITYKWMKDNGTKTQIQTFSNVLSFSSLKLSDGGLYTCEIGLNSIVLIKNTTAKTTHSLEVSSEQQN